MNKHTVTFMGFTFKRNSANRIYTHAVLVLQSRAQDRVNCEANARDWFRANSAFYATIASGERKPFYGNPEKALAEAKMIVEGGEAGCVERALARFDAATAAMQLSSDGDSYYTCAGWCGRRDLADKLAAQSGPRAMILEASR